MRTTLATIIVLLCVTTAMAGQAYELPALPYGTSEVRISLISPNVSYGGTTTVHEMPRGAALLEDGYLINDEFIAGANIVTGKFIVPFTPQSSCTEWITCGATIEIACASNGSYLSYMKLDEENETCDGRCANGIIVQVVCPDDEEEREAEE